MKKEFSPRKRISGFGLGWKCAWSWDRFEGDEPLGRANEDDFPVGKATEPLQKEKQSKSQVNQKKKKGATNQAVTGS